MIKKMIFATSAILLLAACSNEDDLVVAPKLANELGVSVNVKAITRATGEVNSFATSSAVGIFIDGVEAGSYTSKAATYTYNGSTWIAPASEADKIFLSGKEANVYGYFPASGANVDVTAKTMACTVPASQSFNASETDDYMYSTGSAADVAPLATQSVVSNKTEAATTSSLFFHHALSRISFVVNKAESYPAGNKAGILTKITLNGTDGTNALNKFSTDGNVDLTTGTFNHGVTKVSQLTLSGTANSNEYTVPTKDVTAFGLFAPCADLTNINLVFTIDGVEMSKSLAVANVSEWKSGNNYVYTVTVLPRELKVTCQIVPWVVTTEDLGTIQ